MGDTINECRMNEYTPIHLFILHTFIYSFAILYLFFLNEYITKRLERCIPGFSKRLIGSVIVTIFSRNHSQN